MQTRFPSIPGRVKLQRNHAQRKHAKIGHLPKNWGGQPKKTPKNKTFSKQNKGSFGHSGSRYLISTYPKVFLCFGVGAVATLPSFFPMKWTDSDHFGRICPSLFLTFSDWFSRDKLHPTGELLRIQITFLKYFFLKGAGILFMSLTAYPPEIHQCPLKGTLHFQPSFSTTIYYS